jgi:transcriptional regulator with XRE-family HTH domain
MNIGLKIKRLREANSWSQPELAHRLGISQTTLCNSKYKKIDFLLMVKVCQEFEISFDYFLTISNQVKPTVLNSIEVI